MLFVAAVGTWSDFYTYRFLKTFHMLIVRAQTPNETFLKATAAAKSGPVQDVLWFNSKTDLIQWQCQPISVFSKDCNMWERENWGLWQWNVKSKQLRFDFAAPKTMERGLEQVESEDRWQRNKALCCLEMALKGNLQRIDARLCNSLPIKLYGLSTMCALPLS